MAADSKNDVKESTTSTDAELKKAKKKKGLLSRVWGAIFRLHGDDFEKRLQYISKEEAAILSRITRRSNSWRRMTRHLILFSVLLEVKCFSFYYFLDMVIELNLIINILVPVPLWGLLVPISFFVGGGRLISEIACPQWLVGTRYGSVMVFRKLFPLIMFVCLSVVALELRFFIISQAIAIGYAIMITRSLDLNWKMRALRLLPMFLLPLLSSITYFTLRGFTRMFDQKDQKTLEKLRAERQAKIDELKERTNYYTTQQLIQKYDPDPAAKAAAATVLASKLGADSGLKVFVGDDSQQNVSLGKSNDLEVARTSGLRNRKPSPSNNSMQNASTHHIEEHTPNQGGFEGTTMSQQHQMVVEHHPQTGSSMHDGGWIARLAALLVGEDPTQSYALICGNCHMHNGLARKEEFPYVSYYCPHCHALNQAKQSERVSGSNSPSRAPSVVEDADVVPSAGGSIGDRISESNSPVAAVDAISGS